MAKDGQPLLSWRVALLPYLGEQKLYDQFHLDEPWDSPHNRAMIPRIPKIYKPTWGTECGPHETIYRVFVGNGSAFDCGASVSLRDMKEADGTQRTLLVAEATQGVVWTKPEELSYDANEPLPELGVVHQRRFRFENFRYRPRCKENAFLGLIADGSVRLIDNPDLAGVQPCLQLWFPPPFDTPEWNEQRRNEAECTVRTLITGNGDRE